MDDTAYEHLLSRITAKPETFGGKPTIRNLRIGVASTVEMLAQGVSHAELLRDYPELEEDDIRACLAYAFMAIANDRVVAPAVRSA